jgi:hypothetical protein
MKKNSKVNVEVEAKVETKKARKPRQTFSGQILKRIDAKAKMVDRVAYYEIRIKLAACLEDVEKLITEERAKSKQEKTTFKKLAKFSEADIRAYLSQINDVK